MKAFSRLFPFVFCLLPFALLSQDYSWRTHESWNLAEHLDDTLKVYKLHTSIRPFMSGTIRDGVKHERSNSAFCAGVIPVADLTAGFDAGEGSLLYTLGGGAQVHGDFGRRKWVFDLIFTGSMFHAPSYLDSMYKYSGVTNGFGRAFSGPDTWSSEYAEGYLSWSPDKVFNFQLGKGKHFWGDGYRSLFLSDVASSYPYFKISVDVWKLKYVAMYSMHSDMTVPEQSKDFFRTKFSSSHYLSWNATRKWNFSFFETVIWQGTDTNRVRKFDVNYLNPVIFFRPVEYSLGSSDNAMIGFGFRHKTCRYFHWYGQLMLDEFLLKEIKADLSEMISPDDTVDSGWWANKYGWQIGWKAFDVFKIKGLYAQQEFNLVRPFTYAHGSVQQNYGHYNMPLAHPLGANFYELVNILQYNKTRWRIQSQISLAVAGRDSAGKNFGGNIFNSYASREFEYGNKTTQGDKATIMNGGLLVSYLLLEKFDLRTELGVRYRGEKTATASQKDAWVLFGLRTGFLWNRYDDL